MKFLKNIFIICIACYLPLQSMAWGMLGHRIVGEIADTYLTSKAKAEIKQILGFESLAMAANWADFIKSDSNYRYLSPWHYVNFDKGLTYDQMKDFLKTDTATDAYTKINFLISSLKNKKTKLDIDTKRMYLRLLIHIIGDIHQPLHVSAKGTTGGNDIKLMWFTESSNLHRVWDEHLVDFQQLSYTEYTHAINHTTAQQRKQWQSEPMTKWLYDSYTMSNKIIEQAQNQVKDPTTRLGFQYNFQYIETVNQQLVKGGVHLAGILNDIFK